MISRRWITLGIGISAALAVLGSAAVASERAAAKSGGLLVIARDDSTGVPIYGMDVWVHRPVRLVGKTHWEPEWRTITDSGGQALLTGLRGGEYILSLCSETHGLRECEIQVRPGSLDTMMASLRYIGRRSGGRRCEVLLPVDSGVPKGKLVILASEWETGRPVAFGNVMVVGEHRGAMTDEAGAGTISDLEPGLKRLKFRALGWLPRTDSVRVDAGRTDTLRVRLRRDPVRVVN